MARLTRNVDREVIDPAKRLAVERNTTVSAPFSRFIRAMARGRDRRGLRAPPRRVEKKMAERNMGRTQDGLFSCWFIFLSVIFLSVFLGTTCGPRAQACPERSRRDAQNATKIQADTVSPLAIFASWRET